VGQNFCSKCAGRLTTPGPIKSALGTKVGGPNPSFERQSAPTDFARRQDIDKTQTGLILLIIGVVLASVPYSNNVGQTLIVLGIVFAALGRSVFGYGHSRFVIAGLLFYFAGFAVSILNIAAFSSSPFANTLNQFLVGQMIAVLVSGVGIFLLTFAIQKLEGRILLLAGYAATIVVAAVYYAQGGQFSVVLVLTGRGAPQFFAWLNLIPGLINATAFSLAWMRLRRRDIPRAD
jgi:hypothetical protein